MSIEFIFNILASLVFGTLIGSFLNVVIWRLPKNMGLGGRSQCPKCKHQLRSFELLPLLSYVSSNGKCRNCGKPISIRYLLIEGLTGLLFVIAWLVYQPDFGHPLQWILFIKALVVISAAIVIFAIDYEHFLILDKVLLVVGIMILALNGGIDMLSASSFANSLLVSGAIGAAIGGAIFYLLSYFSLMGEGDAKFIILLAFIFGYAQTGILLLVAFWLGLVVSLFLLLSKKAGLKTALPFGTFLSVAAVLMVFCGPRLLNWYLSLIGLYPG
jgi:leader peptidase (prepilin peptidase)/N-methyltransferase